MLQRKTDRGKCYGDLTHGCKDEAKQTKHTGACSGLLRFDRIRNMFLEQIEARGSFRLGKEMTVELEGNIKRR